MVLSKRKASGVKAIQVTPEVIRAFSRDVKSGRLPLNRTQISDDIVTGLRIIINKSGLITFHVSYYVGDDRPFMRIGSFNEDEPDYMTLERARNIARTIKALGDKGIDVQEGLHRRLIRELEEKGVNWKPPK